LWSRQGFLVDVSPIKSEDEIAESAGWDGQKLRLIQRYPETPGKGMPRNQSLAYVEDTVFARFATHPTAAVLMALANTNLFQVLRLHEEPVILGGQRSFPEESNEYTISISTNAVDINASAPGRRILDSGEEVKIDGFTNGFLRWSLHTDDTPDPASSNAVRLSLKYKRFFPDGKKLFQFRLVQGVLLLRRGNVADSDGFNPSVEESNLPVLDYSHRHELSQYLKGLNNSNYQFADTAYRYSLTNHQWNFDEMIISNWTAEVKTSWAKKGVIDPREEVHIISPNRGEKRRAALIVLIIIAIGFPVFLWRKSTDRTKTSKTNN
jgi:hypothetical protein